MIFIQSSYSDELLSDTYVRKSHNFLDWKILSKTKISETIIREFKDKVYWYDISFFQTLSEDFIREFKDKVDWNNISYKQKLSEDFIREFKDKVNWYNISYNMIFSKKFIIMFESILKKKKVYCCSINKFVKVIFLQRKIKKFLYTPGNPMYLKTMDHFKSLQN